MEGQLETSGKPAWKSLGVLGGAAAVGFGAYEFYGWMISPEGQGAVKNIVEGLVLISAGSLAIYGRVMALVQITGLFKAR
jgi:hypothetical protein